MTYFEYLKACKSRHVLKEQTLNPSQFLALGKPAREALERKLATDDDDASPADDDRPDDDDIEDHDDGDDDDDDDDDEDDDEDVDDDKPVEEKERAMSDSDQVVRAAGFESVKAMNAERAKQGLPAFKASSKRSTRPTSLRTSLEGAGIQADASLEEAQAVLAKAKRAAGVR